MRGSTAISRVVIFCLRRLVTLNLVSIVVSLFLLLSLTSSFNLHVMSGMDAYNAYPLKMARRQLISVFPQNFPRR
jgi:hypothetical protein